MDTLKLFIRYIVILCLSIGLWSCEGRREVEGTEEITVDTAEKGDTARVIKTGNTAEDELEEFRAWLNRQTEKGDTAIRREWPAVREELRERNARLEQKFDSLSAESKEEYRELQSRYERWEERQERRQQQPLAPAELAQWRERLLRDYQNLDKVKPENIREAYLTFMGEVRTNRRTWTQNDWDYVDYVYSQLNQRRGEIEGQLRTADKLKIRTLQAEYLTLEGAADTQSMLQGSTE
ncbi:hypothetical protein GCM10023188_33270 [Pontibacter saemangeumensis]|uniref:Uncharacterized protein n=1 Tax=Pontibacter saemangeumensis TaxID=1084525 RepID=A0ABP8LVQ7_9BACT